MLSSISNLSILSTVQHGVGANMLKTESKRRRTKQQIEEDKLEEIRKENEIENKLAQVD